MREIEKGLNDRLPHSFEPENQLQGSFFRPLLDGRTSTQAAERETGHCRQMTGRRRLVQGKKSHVMAITGFGLGACMGARHQRLGFRVLRMSAAHPNVLVHVLKIRKSDMNGDPELAPQFCRYGRHKRHRTFFF
jgi:hypothetical protein